jgi:hypothetical protein
LIAFSREFGQLLLLVLHAGIGALQFSAASIVTMGRRHETSNLLHHSKNRSGRFKRSSIDRRPLLTFFADNSQFCNRGPRPSVDLGQDTQTKIPPLHGLKNELLRLFLFRERAAASWLTKVIRAIRHRHLIRGNRPIPAFVLASEIPYPPDDCLTTKIDHQFMWMSEHLWLKRGVPVGPRIAIDRMDRTLPVAA